VKQFGSIFGDDGRNEEDSPLRRGDAEKKGRGFTAKDAKNAKEEE
jgi:hypothetical protein